MVGSGWPQLYFSAAIAVQLYQYRYGVSVPLPTYYMLNLWMYLYTTIRM